MLPESNDVRYFNGIDGDSGNYFFPDVSHRNPATSKGKDRYGDRIHPLAKMVRALFRKKRCMIDGCDPAILDQAGWGIIFPADRGIEAVSEALEPLLRLRREVAGNRFTIYSGDRGYIPGETASSFLARQGAVPGPVDPSRMPYYLLLVGGPEDIPFSFQYYLDIQYAVGRLSLSDLDALSNYAHRVEEHEKKKSKRTLRYALFGTAHENDPATARSTEHLLTGLARVGISRIDRITGDAATKDRLQALCGGPETPDVLFTATHGVCFRKGHDRQIRFQGSPICGEWRGPGNKLAMEHLFTADDLCGRAGPRDFIAFHFSCFGAGTPRFCGFEGGTAKTIAASAFMADLPAAMLGARGKGALAIVAHVDRAFEMSFFWHEQPGIQTFDTCLQRLGKGYPLGWAMDPFGLRYAELRTQANEISETIALFPKADQQLIIDHDTLRRAAHDTRGFVVLGDPAVSITQRDPEEGSDED